MNIRIQEQFEDIKDVIKSRTSNDRQCYDQKPNIEW
jgi:hypothetical protein